MFLGERLVSFRTAMLSMNREQRIKLTRELANALATITGFTTVTQEDREMVYAAMTKARELIGVPKHDT